MKSWCTSRFGIGILLAGAVLFHAGAAWSTGIAFESERPRYAKIVLTEDGSKILSIAFDELGGTGTGYDMLYADLNFNGNLTDDRVTSTKLQSAGPCVFAEFSLDVPVPYNEKGRGVAKPSSLAVGHMYYQGGGDGEQERCTFFASAGITLKDGSGEWQYGVLPTELNTSGKLDEARPTVLGGRPGLELSAVPDSQTEGRIGISVQLTIDKRKAGCLKGGRPVKAFLKIKDMQGQVIYSDTVSTDKLVPG